MAKEPEKIEGTIVEAEDPSIKAEAEKVEAERKEAEAKAAKEKAAQEEPKKEAKTETQPKVETPKSHGLNLAKENANNEDAAAQQGDPETCYSDSKTRTTSSSKE